MPPPERGGPGWLPERFRSAQLVAPRQAITGLVAAALLAAVVTAALLWWTRPRPTTIEPPHVVAPGATVPARITPAAPSAAATVLVVSVVGRVRRPGLVKLPAGSRVADALTAVGGALPGVDLTPLNLARKLNDGEQVVVGVPAAQPDPAAPSVPGSGGTAPSGPVNLNTATLAELDALPGVGPVIAQRILDYRTEHGSFTSVDELGDVTGIGDATLEHLRPLVTV